MELTVGAWFGEIGISFNFSHRVDLYIRQEIKENIMKPLGLLESFPDKFLHLRVMTGSTQSELKVIIGRKWSARTISRSHNLLFPYFPIVNSAYPLKEYLNCYMNCLPIIFKEFGVTQKQLDTVRLNCENEILNNKDYVDY